MKSGAIKIAVTGHPEWGGAAAMLLESLGYGLSRYPDATGYVPRLVAENVALIVVDGDSPHWQTFATLPAANAATRRIPVVVVTSDKTKWLAAHDAGVVAAISPDSLTGMLPELIDDFALLSSPDALAELNNQCAQALPPLARQGIAKFNAGEYYPQHDLFEELWMLESGPVRDLYRAILQVGVAYYQITRGNRNGALKMLLRATPWLSRLPDVCQGVDVAQLRRDARRVQAELQAVTGGDLADFDRGLLRPVKLVEN